MPAGSSDETGSRASRPLEEIGSTHDTHDLAVAHDGNTLHAVAFVAVQGAFNWLVDNYPRLAEWLSSANRVGTLLAAFDRLTSRDESTFVRTATTGEAT